MSPGKNSVSGSLKPPVVVLTADSSHAWGAAVTLASMVRSNPGLPIDVRLLHDGLDPATLDYFEEVSLRLGLENSLRCVNVAAELPTGLSNQRHYSRTAYARYVAPQILEDHDQLFYLDSDILCQTSLTTMWTFDLSVTRHAFAAVNLGLAGNCFRHVPADLKAAHHVGAETSIFSTGVMLINRGIWNANGITEQLLDFANRHHHLLEAIDQDAMNLLFPERNFSLDPRFNIATPLSPGKVSHTPLYEGFYHICDGLKPWSTTLTLNPLRVEGLWHIIASRIPRPGHGSTNNQNLPRFSIPGWLKFVLWSYRHKRFSYSSISSLAGIRFRNNRGLNWTQPRCPTS